MVVHGGRYYLFYSGNAWRSASYGTGYAICEKAQGPCVKPRSRPLLDSDAEVAGPGGADAFVGPSGRLRLMYAAWDAGRVGVTTPYARRMHIATVSAGPRGRLRVEEMR